MALEMWLRVATPQRSSLLSAFLVFIVVYLLSIPTARAEETIHITNGEWEPYLSEYCPHYGLYSHIVTESFLLVGIKVKYDFFPWGRALLEAQDGENYQGSIAWSHNEARAKLFEYSDAVATRFNVFFHRKELVFDWNTMKDIEPYRVGVTRGYYYETEFNAALDKGRFKVNVVTQDEQNIQMLLLNRIDIWPNEVVVGRAQIRNTLTSEQAALLTYHPKRLGKGGYHLIVAKNYSGRKSLIVRFNKGLKQLKASGRYDKYMTDAERGKYAKGKAKWTPID